MSGGRRREPENSDPDAIVGTCDGCGLEVTEGTECPDCGADILWPGGPLKPLHGPELMLESKLVYFRAQTTEWILESLQPGGDHALKTRPDGTMLEGHHRILVLRERGIDCDSLPREVVPADTD